MRLASWILSGLVLHLAPDTTLAIALIFFNLALALIPRDTRTPNKKWQDEQINLLFADRRKS